MADDAFRKGLKLVAKFSSDPKKNDKEFNGHKNINEILRNILGEEGMENVKFLNTNFICKVDHRCVVLPKFQKKSKLKMSYFESYFRFHYPIINLKTNSVAVLRVTMKTTTDDLKLFKTEEQLQKEREEREATTSYKIKHYFEEKKKERALKKEGKKLAKVSVSKLSKTKQEVKDLKEEIQQIENDLKGKDFSEEEIEEFYKHLDNQKQIEEANRKKMLAQQKRMQKKRAPPPRFEDIKYELDTVDICNCADFVSDDTYFYQMGTNLVNKEYVFSWPYPKKIIPFVSLVASKITPVINSRFKERLPAFTHGKQEDLKGYLMPDNYEDEGILPPETEVFY